MTPRPAAEADFPVLVRVWHDAWHDAHAHLVPPALIALRTLESFAARLPTLGDRLRIAGPVGAPCGLCVVKDDEIDQLFLARAARGTGLAAGLLADGQARLARDGVALARLDCAPGNIRAIRFYEKHGWRREALRPVTLEGSFELPCLLFVKTLGTP